MHEESTGHGFGSGLIPLALIAVKICFSLPRGQIYNSMPFYVYCFVLMCLWRNHLASKLLIDYEISSEAG